ncbi:MAG: hypothetical protein KatS3mg105_4634 [Gemmatales bacterium]|nr:MAG: hypothetical protein KatS3mg105_4634 [Gemmatales bacterium]
MTFRRNCTRRDRGKALAPTRRAAFTLIELLVVIAIIAVLAGLTMSGVMRVYATLDEANNRNGITQLDVALKQLVMKYGPPPDMMRLGEREGDCDPVTRNYLAKMFPNITRNGIWQSGIDWNRNGAIDGPVTLNDGQTLFFLLAGFQNQGFVFKTNNPVAGTGAVPEWKDSQIDRSSPYWRYTDIYGTPIRFVSSLSYSPAKGAYYSATGVPFNPKTFQIISAGRDRQFGPGGPVPTSGPGADNQTNFTPGLLRGAR